MLPAKATYLDIDMVHANKYFGLPDVKKPSVFPLLTVKVHSVSLGWRMGGLLTRAQPQRALIYIRDKFPEPVFLSAFRHLWVALWEKDWDITQESQLARAWSGLFSEEQLKAVLAAADSQEYKQRLIDNTAEAVKEGAFGAPWFVVWNKRGEVTRFFGSDRFYFMFEFLEVPYTRLGVDPAAKL